MFIKTIVGEGGLLPQNAHGTDTGYDVVAASKPYIMGIGCGKFAESWYRVDYIEYDLGLKVEPHSKFIDGKIPYLLIFPRSSVSKYNLVLANSVGIVDNSYRNTIKVRFKYIWQPEDMFTDDSGGILGRVNLDKIYQKGDKVAQLVGAVKNQVDWEYAEQLTETKRGEGGFGSTGK